MDFDNHPIRFVRTIFNSREGEYRLEFSRYFYRPGSIFDERETFAVDASELCDAWLSTQLSALRPGWELALNSRVTDSRNRSYHIGMIDFAEAVEVDRLRNQVRNLLGEDMFLGMDCFDSGRSFHGYFRHLLRPGQWHEFLGRLLLMNEPDSHPVVDARWVGHRLIGGYGALRWSKNGSRYMSYPVRRVVHV